ncbi:MAG: ferrous iron transporter B [Candidatus Omnitrophica bacterium]|nr:ferrous iron transporter B [Candidatus Omnitrophota bacterium]
MRVVLVGNPNVGKSAVFFRLTGAKVLTSNYPGTTVEFAKGVLIKNSERVDIIDAPGAYSIEPTNKAEEVTVRLLKEAAIVVNVIDATNLERNLYLTLQLIKQQCKLLVVLNMWDETKHKGIDIDIDKLQNLLGVPVVHSCGLSGEGIKDIALKLNQAKVSSLNLEGRDLWEIIGEITSSVQTLHHKHHSFRDVMEEITIHPFTGIPFSVVVLGLCFLVVRFIGESLIHFALDPFFENIYKPFLWRLNELIHWEFLRNILIGGLINENIEFMQSLGVLSTGIYVPIAVVFPYVLSFYFVLGLLEDFGYLPRLSVLMDNVMHKLGLHGVSVIPFILSLGCNVPGVLASRVLESRRERFILATLTAISIPCMAQISMIVGVLGKYGLRYILMVFGTLFLVWFSLGVILNKFIRGESPEILMEIPPYRKINLYVLFRKLWIRISGFIKEAVPLVLLGVFMTNLLFSLGVLKVLGIIVAPVVTFIWGLPEKAILALLVGFLRKDVAVGMLGPLGLSPKQLVVGCTILAIYFPCMGTFSVLLKELGLKDMCKSLAIMLIVAILVGGLLNLIIK